MNNAATSSILSEHERPTPVAPLSVVHARAMRAAAVLTLRRGACTTCDAAKVQCEDARQTAEWLQRELLTAYEIVEAQRTALEAAHEEIAVYRAPWRVVLRECALAIWARIRRSIR